VRRANAPREDRAIRTAAAVCAAVLLVVLGASLVVRYPMLQGFDPAFPPPVWTYVRQAVIVCGTFLRFGAPDMLTSLDFWGGFGWLDTPAPAVLVQGLAIASGAVLIGLLAWTGMAASGRTLVALTCVALGFVASVAAYAYSVVHIIGVADLHGRYLVGLYLTVLVVAWTGAARLVPMLTPRWRHGVAVAAAAGILATHTYCVCMILRRYF
jgi:hypothetical protein